MYCHFPFELHPIHELPRTDGWEGRSHLDRWIRLRGYTWLWNWRMRGYQTLLSNSNFTSGWIERLWKRPSEVLYPPVAIESASVAKENIIVSLGRFIVTDGKNHALQLKAFREFLSVTGGDWRLCLIGFCTDLPQDRDLPRETPSHLQRYSRYICGQCSTTDTLDSSCKSEVVLACDSSRR